MARFGLLPIIGSLLLQQILGYTQPINPHGAATPDLQPTAQQAESSVPAAPVVPTQAMASSAIQGTNSHPSPLDQISKQHAEPVSVKKKKIPFPMSLFYNEVEMAPVIQHTMENMNVTLVQFMNVHRNKSVPKPFIEVQMSVPQYADDKEVALLHFKMLQGVPQEKFQIVNAKLTLKKTGDGKEYGMTCQTKNIKIAVPSHHDIGGNLSHVGVGPGVSVDTSKDEVVGDLTSLFLNGAQSINPYDFWIMIETDPQCYYNFSGKPKDVQMTLTISKEVTLVARETVLEKRPYVMAAPCVVLGVLGVLGAIYIFRKNRTDYTYFQDHGEYVEGL